MNILPLNNLPLSNLNINNYKFASNNTAQNNTTNFGLKMARPISCDSVSFGATPKNLQSWKGAMSRNVAIDIYKITSKRQKKVDTFVEGLWGSLCCTKYRPDNLIYKLSCRAKMPDSIIEKAATREWSSKSEVFAKMTDLNGAKIVLRDGSRPPVEIVLSALESAVLDGKVEVVEIENKRPHIAEKLKGVDSLKYDYALPDTLKHLKLANDSIHPSKKAKLVPCDYTKSNYPAIHILCKLPGEDWVFELQIMGYDVALYKDLDDILFKILNFKNVDKKCKPIVDIIKPLNKPGNSAIKDSFNQYRSNVFLFQREKAPHIRKTKQYTERFLPIKDEIEDGELRDLLDMNHLYELFLECNAKKPVKKKPVQKS